jgi:hypothetical protein
MKSDLALGHAGAKLRSPTLLAWHRRIGITACLGVVLWGISGVIHPIMSRLQPVPARFAPPADPVSLAAACPLPQVLAAHGITEVQAIRLVGIEGRAYFQVTRPGWPERLYFDIASGALLETGEELYAERLARHYLDDETAKVVSIRRIDAFDDEYTFVNRLLPVYRVEFDRPDRMRVFVDTGSGRLGTLVDERKYWLSLAFRQLHTWEFLSRVEPLRTTLMLGLLLAGSAAALAGVAVYARGRSRRAATPEPRRSHRRLGVTVAGAAMLFTLSGAYHLFLNPDLVPDPRTSRPSFRVDELDSHVWRHLGEVGEIGFARLPEGVFLRVMGAGAGQAASPSPHHAPSAERQTGAQRGSEPYYLHLKTGVEDAEAELRHAKALAAQAIGVSPDRVNGEPVQVARFGGEYGFVFKRLPVWRVSFSAPGNPAVYVDTGENAVAAIIRDPDRREGWVFAHLHKWDWLAHLLGKNLRDLTVALLALGNALVALIGAWMFLRPKWNGIRVGFRQRYSS